MNYLIRVLEDTLLHESKFLEKNILSPLSRSPIRRYSLAFSLSICAVFLLRLVRVPEDFQVLIIFTVIILSSWYGGIGPALITMFTMGTYEIVIRFLYSGDSFSTLSIVRLLIYAAAALVLSYLIASKRGYEQQLYVQALQDPLTGLPNRRLVEEKLDFAVERAKRNKETVAVLFLDLDKFKAVNDTHGHEVGDMLLIDVGRRIEECVRKQDCVGRLGGDEFVVVLLDLKNSHGAKIVAHKIIEMMEKEFKLKNNVIKTSTSIGISVYPDDARSRSDLMNNADKALYVVKRLCRNNYLLYSEMSK